MSASSTLRSDLRDVIEDIRSAQRKLACAWANRNDEDQGASDLMDATVDLSFALDHAEDALKKAPEEPTPSDVSQMATALARSNGRSAEQ